MEQLWRRPQRLLVGRAGLLLVSSSAALLYIVWPILAAYLQLGGCGSGNRRRRRRHQSPPGLINYGNSCYANCLLQALASCDAFCCDLAARLAAWAVDASDSNAVARVPLASRLSHLLAGLRGDSSISPRTNDETETEDVDALELLTALRERDWDPAACQQDAHELLSVLLQAINEELLAASRVRGPTLSAVTEPDGSSGDVELEDRPTLSLSGSVSVRSAPEQRSWVQCGLVQTRIKCLSCGYRTPARLEVLHSLSLSLQNDDASLGPGPVPLQLLLQRTFRVELVRRARCDKCCAPPAIDDNGDASDSRTVTLSRTTRLARAPATLVLHLQRVSWSSRYGCPIKSTAPVSFPILLDIRPLMPHPASATASPSTEEAPLPTAPSSPCKLYRLVAVIVHLGDEMSGHYVAHRWDAVSRRWWRISDDSVLPVSEATVLGLGDVYMLFYELLVI